ncbi:cbb3-type cytochrome oxidase assembly protein CcoS [Sinorhizobium sp. BG8]|uniref:cbb3-type cytochrome oxidase assembly protein CcoS n=1 Tax=Sinorhizobium sp. BG8 TaxID=2613773 RepID=UPI00193C8EA3|nr:cbb3-type cytochrome oxidase assembly protein CcoS [Sinorhizobium sp. BG8]QRM55900.1 cbb3-type cytochrome oxidase assembly protein CcoS [Sinorhizobium sp. BG8]
MRDFFFLIPVSIALGVAGLMAFLWSLRRGQYDDLDGAAERILYGEDVPLQPPLSTAGKDEDRYGRDPAGQPRSKHSR